MLWGHHFAAVAGAAPIVGPAIAVIWGWLPAFLWVILGTVFFAGIHDFGALWASVRHQGRSIGALTEEIVGTRARNVFMIVIFLLLLMVNAVFAIVIANLMVSVPSSVIPVWAVIAVAMVVGVMIYKKGMPLIWVTVIGVVVLYGLHIPRRSDSAVAPGPVVRTRRSCAVGRDPLRVCRNRVDSAGLAVTPAARLHQWDPALGRSRHTLSEHPTAPARTSWHRR